MAFERKKYDKPKQVTGPEYGKIPPQARELEEAVLGAVMIEANAIEDVIDVIKTPEVFYLDAHQRIWRAITALFYEGLKIDILTVFERLKTHGDSEKAGGALYVSELTNKVGSSANIGDHAKILVEKFVGRKIIEVSQEAIKNAFDDTTDVFQLLDSVSTQIEEITSKNLAIGQRSFSDIVADEYEAIKRAATTPDNVTGVRTYSYKLDRGLGGWQPGTLNIIAGRPGMGKTSVAWHIAINQAKHNIPVGFFSLEMVNGELIRKMFSAETSIDTRSIKKGQLSDDEWQVLTDSLRQTTGYPIFLEDRAGLSINQITAITRQWVKKHGVRVIYIDYIGKIKTYDSGKRFGTREQEVSHISGALKDLAKQLSIPVVCLSQLSREVEKKPDKRPELSHLRESGAVEQDADVVIFPWRPEYYGIETDADGNRFPSGYTLLDIAKFRDGNPGEVDWIFEAKYSRFHDLEEISQVPLTDSNKPFKRIADVSDEPAPW